MENADKTLEEECKEKAEQYLAEAEKNAFGAFTEGYLLGMQHAKKVYGETKEKIWEK